MSNSMSIKSCFVFDTIHWRIFHFLAKITLLNINKETFTLENFSIFLYFLTYEELDLLTLQLKKIILEYALHNVTIQYDKIKYDI